MSDSEAAVPGWIGVTLSLLAILLAAVVFLFYFASNAPDYTGFAVMMAIPAAIGGLISQASDPVGKESPMGCFVWPTLGLIGVVIIAAAFLREGAICIAMILPIWIPAAIGGAVVNRWNARRWRAWHARNATFHSAAWLLLPFMLLVIEDLNPPVWERRQVVREIEIPSSPEVVLPLLQSVRNIRASEGRWTFTQDVLQVPRPRDAVLSSDERELVRKARWGASITFEERLTELEPQKIAWTFVFPNGSVQEHTDRHISPDGPVLKIESGEYQLSRLGNGHTSVRLTTTYRMRARFTPYLAWWGERLLGDVQNNILEIIKSRSSSVSRA